MAGGEQCIHFDPCILGISWTIDLLQVWDGGKWGHAANGLSSTPNAASQPQSLTANNRLDQCWRQTWNACLELRSDNAPQATYTYMYIMSCSIWSWCSSATAAMWKTFKLMQFVGPRLQCEEKLFPTLVPQQSETWVQMSKRACWETWAHESGDDSKLH